MHCQILAGLTLACCLSGCQRDHEQAPPKEQPAKIELHPSEKDIYRIVLTPKAEERLQITTVAVERRRVLRSRLLGGDLIVPDGQRIPVTAPLTGTLLQAEGQPVVSAGQHVRANQALLQLLPMLPPEREVPNAAERVQMANSRVALITAQIQADGDVKQAEAQVEAARIALARAAKLLADKAGSRRDVDEAEAAMNIVTESLAAARERRTELDKLSLDAETGVAAVVPIHSPTAGIVQNVSAQIGQVVSAGAALFEIVDLRKLWVRVPVYAGQVDEVDLTSNAAVGGLSESNVDDEARPITAPPTANALAASIDLYYEVDNSDGRFRPGERVTVQVPLKGDAESLVVPRAAVLRDIYGTAWVYVNSGEHEFRRERVAVDFSTEELAVLSMGPDVGTAVVVDGAAELFGTEFGAGK